MNLFSRRVRGFRLIDLVAAGLLVMIILGVYLAKTVAGGQRTEIAQTEQKIAAEKERIRLLQAEVAHLERPGRIERLAVVYLGMGPVTDKNEATVGQLGELAHAGPPGKEKAPSAIAAIVNGADVVPGVPPPAPGQPLRLAEAQTGGRP